MAAAEYFSTIPMATNSPPSGPMPAPPLNHRPSNGQQYYPPPPQQIRHNSQPPLYQPTQTSPQLQPQRPAVHFAPSPPPQRQSVSNQHRPSLSSSPQQTWQQPVQRPMYSPQYSSSNLSSHYQPPGLVRHNNVTPMQNHNYLSPHPAPYAHSNSSAYSLDHGSISDPEARRRRRHRYHRRDSQETREIRKNSRSTGADAFLGAAGGGLIGDLIMPGLGTLGGAAIGWLSGKDYGRRRKEREDDRMDKQRQWEDKYGQSHPPRHHYGSRSRGNSYGGPEEPSYYHRRRSADERDERDDYYNHR